MIRQRHCCSYAVDPVQGGSLNNYDYANQDPINGYDLNGTMTGQKDDGRMSWHDTVWLCEAFIHDSRTSRQFCNYRSDPWSSVRACAKGALKTQLPVMSWKEAKGYLGRIASPSGSPGRGGLSPSHCAGPLGT